jgi:hypothetical protein
MVGLYTLRACDERRNKIAPRLTPVWLGGVHAYAEKSIAAGETIHFRVSSTERYQLSVVKLGPEMDNPSQNTVVYAFPESPAKQQAIFPGSYVNIDKPLPAHDTLRELTLECWVRPFRNEGPFQGLVTQHTYDNACGFGLFINGDGCVEFYLGDGGNYDPKGAKIGPKLELHQWYHLVGVWDGSVGSLWVQGETDPAWQWDFTGPVRPGSAPLRLGAYGEDGLTGHFLDGDLAMPVIYNRALSKEEIQQRYHTLALQTPDVDGLLGCWPLNEEKGARVEDIGLEQRHGRIINHATWMIGGPAFNGSVVTRYGWYDPAKDPFHGHGLRFASDDLYDCGWEGTPEYRIPATQTPGVYVGHIRYGESWQYLYDVTFIVRKAKRRPKAPILVLCSANTWLAYSSIPFVREKVSAESPRREWYPYGNPNTSIDDAPAYSFYRSHSDEQPTYHIGLNLPWPAAGPYVLYSPESGNYSHLTRAERFTHVWLDENGYDYDVIADFDLHRDPSLLDGYQVLLINGHSEYWSVPMYEAVERFLQLAGNVVALSGNTVWWRVSFDEDVAMMECRKADLDPSLGGQPHATMGETYHSDDGQRGGLMRECGYPAWSLLGIEFAGFDAGPPMLRPYTCEQPTHFLFTTPTPINLSQGDTFADKSVGHEWDIRNSLPQQGVPPYAEPGIETLAKCQKHPSDSVFDYFWRPVEDPDATISEMIYWERPIGGRVFYAGSVGAGAGLNKNNREWSTLMRNVLHHLLAATHETKAIPGNERSVPNDRITQRNVAAGLPTRAASA